MNRSRICVEILALERHGEFGGLSLVAQIRFPEKRGTVGLVAVGRELGGDLLAQLRLDRGEIGDAHPVEPLADGLQRGMLDVGSEHAERAEDARHRRNHHAWNAELPRQIRRVHAAVAAERHQREVAGIEAAFDGDRADRARHRGIGHGADAMRRVLHRQRKRISDMDADRPSRSARGRYGACRPPARSR